MKMGLDTKVFDWTHSVTTNPGNNLFLRPMEQLPQGTDESERIGDVVHIHSCHYHLHIRPSNLEDIGPGNSFASGSVRTVSLINGQPIPTAPPGWTDVFATTNITAFQTVDAMGQYRMFHDDVIDTWVTTDREQTNIDQTTGVVSSTILPVTHYDTRRESFTFDPPLRVSYVSGTLQLVAGDEPIFGYTAPDNNMHFTWHFRFEFTDQ